MAPVEGLAYAVGAAARRNPEREMFDVGDPVRNAVLTGCFLAIALLTVAAIVPWKALGAARLSGWARWLFVPVLALAVGYEAAMPSRFDIRVDLLLLVPMYGVVVLACLVRWLLARRGRPASSSR